jgi:hypothetical protein
MAIVEGFQRSKRNTFHVQLTSVICHYAVFEPDAGKRILQLDTFGSSSREIPGKISQTLQLDEAQARALWKLLGKEF